MPFFGGGPAGVAFDGALDGVSDGAGGEELAVALDSLTALLDVHPEIVANPTTAITVNALVQRYRLGAAWFTVGSPFRMAAIVPHETQASAYDARCFRDIEELTAINLPKP